MRSEWRQLGPWDLTEWDEKTVGAIQYHLERAFSRFVEPGGQQQLVDFRGSNATKARPKSFPFLGGELA